MANYYTILFVSMLLFALVSARPTELENQLSSNPLSEDQSPQFYLIFAEPDDDGSNNAEITKRSAEDLETAAGTNVLRPLFVYRQQLAYRERVKKGISRIAGIRPRF